MARQKARGCGVPVAQLLVEEIAMQEGKSERSLMHRYNYGAVSWIRRISWLPVS